MERYSDERDKIFKDLADAQRSIYEDKDLWGDNEEDMDEVLE